MSPHLLLSILGFCRTKDWLIDTRSARHSQSGRIGLFSVSFSVKYQNCCLCLLGGPCLSAFQHWIAIITQTCLTVVNVFFVALTHLCEYKWTSKTVISPFSNILWPNRFFFFSTSQLANHSLALWKGILSGQTCFFSSYWSFEMQGVDYVLFYASVGMLIGFWDAGVANECRWKCVLG